MIQLTPPKPVGAQIRRSMWRRVFCALPIFFLTTLPEFAAPQANIQYNNVLIQGVVRTADGQPIGVSVKLQLQRDNGDVLDETLTHADGQYNFKPLPGGSYRLVVTAPGFEKHEEEIPSSIGVRLRICNVILKPISKNPEETTQNDQPQGVRLVPKDARKVYERAMKDLNSKRPRKAEAHLRHAIELYPCFAEAHARLGVLLEDRQELKAAETSLKTAIECDPDYVTSYTLLGQLLNKQGRFTESVKVLEEGERRAPSLWPLCYELGVAYFGAGDYSKAEQEYQKVLEVNPSPPPDIPLRLADVYMKQNAYEKAYAEMRQYLKTSPNGFYAEKVRNILQKANDQGHP